MPSKPVSRTRRESAAPVAPSINEMLRALLGETPEVPAHAVTISDLAAASGRGREYCRKLADAKVAKGEWQKATTVRTFETGSKRQAVVYWPA